MEIDNRRAIYNKVWEQEAHELPITYLWTWKNVAGVSAKVQGFEPISNGLIRLQGISLTR